MTLTLVLPRHPQNIDVTQCTVTVTLVTWYCWLENFVGDPVVRWQWVADLLPLSRLWKFTSKIERNNCDIHGTVDYLILWAFNCCWAPFTDFKVFYGLLMGFCNNLSSMHSVVIARRQKGVDQKWICEAKTVGPSFKFTSIMNMDMWFIIFGIVQLFTWILLPQR